MNTPQFILASLKQYRRVHLAVVAGVAVATAVITGALLVGDSVRGSLRGLALERLGKIDSLVVAEEPFRAALADQLLQAKSFQESFDGVAPLLVTPGTLASTGANQRRRATNLTIVGCEDSFWQFDESHSPVALTGGEVAITQSIADELGAAAGDEILLRLPTYDSLPADSALGEKSETTTSLRCTVAQVLPSEGLYRFSLRPSQLPPRNVFIRLGELQELMELAGRVNALAVGGKSAEQPVDETVFESLREALAPTLGDFNLQVEQIDEVAGAGYLRITADRLVLRTALVDAVREALPDAPVQPAITYLANTIQRGEKKVPYSTVAGVESIPGIGPLLDDTGQPMLFADDEVVLNSWAAEQLGAAVGDSIRMTYYQPETTHGALREAEPLELRLRAVVPLVDAAGNATTAQDPKLTPTLKGVTDQRSIRDWDLPFELVETIRPEDDDYWDKYSTTPKAFVSYELAKRLWGTRWGTDSLLRIPTVDGVTVAEIEDRVHPAPDAMGMLLVPVKRQALAASKGTTSFEGLFLGFSFFLMASAVMLISLLFRLGTEGRAAELGVLAAVGCSARRLRRLWLGEALVLAVVGSAIGVVAGIGYAKLMIHGLSTWWVAATVTAFLSLHVTLQSLLVGFFGGVIVSLATIAISLRKLVRLPVRQLLSGDCEDHTRRFTATKRRKQWFPIACLVLALGLVAGGITLEGEAQAGAFFGSGALVLTGLLVALGKRLRSAATGGLQAFSLAGLAVRNVRRNPSRTMLSIGLAAVASFLIVALSAFRLAPSEQGTGGFDLIATSDQPIYFDLSTPQGRGELGFNPQDEAPLTGASIAAFRVSAGEDASCLNLYQTAQPEVVGLAQDFDDGGRFAWAGHAGDAASWELLRSETSPGTVPVVLDKNTAAYSLHLGGVGSQFEIKDAAGQPATLEVVGLLAGSVLQGKALVSEENFLKLFPDVAGHKLFLIRKGSAGTSTDQLATLLETKLEDYGFDAVDTHGRLAEFMAVQNTYLSTFQALGGLGLLLGACGLAVAQLRSVLERRGELALLRSAGFRRRRLAEMVLGENMALLLGGLGIGSAAALVAVLPQWIAQQAGVPWQTLLALLAAVAVTGGVAGWLAIRAALQAPLLPALRGD